MESALKLAVVGANGLITESLLAAIENHPSLSGEVVLLGSAESSENTVEFNGHPLFVEDIEGYAFDEIDILVATGETAYQGDWLESARDAGCIILDVGGQLPGQAGQTGVVAGVNDSLLSEVAAGSLVVLPDGATVQAARLLHPLLQQLRIARVSLFSCNAVSDKGRSGVEEMARQTAQMLNGKPARPVLFPRQVAFNLLPMAADEVSGVHEDPQTRLADNLRRILRVEDLPMTVSCCWAPVFYGHTQALHLTTTEGVTLERVQRILAKAADIDLHGGTAASPTAVTDASGSDFLTVGRLSVDAKNSTEFSLWAVADNLRYGIAGNAVKIIELLVKRLFISYS